MVAVVADVVMFAILSYDNSINLGDEIQSIATLCLLHENGIDPDYYIDRDTTLVTPRKPWRKSIHDALRDWRTRSSIRINCIYNGWFDGDYTHWPPPEVIRPFFISFHVNEQPKERSYDYMSQHKKRFKSLADRSLSGFYADKLPIGCRDPHTVDLFTAAGYQSYFSGCLTMTLRRRMPEGPRNGVYLVDVDITDLIPVGLTYVQVSHVYEGQLGTPEATELKFAEAQKLLLLYEGARLVITSRLHCALPCLAFGTPVVFSHPNVEDVRFRGLIDTIPVLGRDPVDLDTHTNKLPPDWDRLVESMRATVKGRIIECLAAEV